MRGDPALEDRDQRPLDGEQRRLVERPLGHGRQHGLGQVVARLDEHVLLRRVVAEERPARDPGGRRDLGDRRRLVAALAEQLPGGVEQLRPHQLLLPFLEAQFVRCHAADYGMAAGVDWHVVLTMALSASSVRSHAQTTSMIRAGLAPSRWSGRGCRRADEWAR